MFPIVRTIGFSAAVLFAAAAQAQVDVKDAWVRTAVPGQSGTGAFMTLTSKEGARLVGASSPVAATAPASASGAAPAAVDKAGAHSGHGSHKH